MGQRVVVAVAAAGAARGQRAVLGAGEAGVWEWGSSPRCLWAALKPV